MSDEARHRPSEATARRPARPGRRTTTGPTGPAGAAGAAPREAPRQEPPARPVRWQERVKPWDTPEWQEAIDAQVAKFPKQISARAALHLAFLLGLCDEYGNPLPQPETEPETGIGDEKEPASETRETTE